MKLFVGKIDYFATGEGRQLYLFARRSENESSFIKEMKDTLNIDEYYMYGIEIISLTETEEWLQKYVKSLDGCFGHVAFKYHLNCC